MPKTCDFPPPAHDAFAKTHNDVRWPHPRCNPITHQHQHTHTPTADAPTPKVLHPSLFVPCCAHSGTTFLWRCMRYAYHPERVCATPQPNRLHSRRLVEQVAAVPI